MTRMNELPRWIAFPYHRACEAQDPAARRLHAQQLLEAIFEYLSVVALSAWLALPLATRSSAVDVSVRRCMAKKMGMGDWSSFLTTCCDDPQLAPIILGPQIGKFDADSPVTRFVNSVSQSARQSASVKEFFAACCNVRNTGSHGSAWGPDDQKWHAGLLASASCFLESTQLATRLRLVFVRGATPIRGGQRVEYKDLSGNGLPSTRKLGPGEPGSGLNWLADELAVWDGAGALIQIPTALAEFDDDATRLWFFSGPRSREGRLDFA